MELEGLFLTKNKVKFQFKMQSRVFPRFVVESHLVGLLCGKQRYAKTLGIFWVQGLLFVGLETTCSRFSF
jgi:hypothetical protein